jgi:hypothetical protein
MLLSKGVAVAFLRMRLHDCRFAWHQVHSLETTSSAGGARHGLAHCQLILEVAFNMAKLPLSTDVHYIRDSSLAALMLLGDYPHNLSRHNDPASVVEE